MKTLTSRTTLPSLDAAPETAHFSEVAKSKTKCSPYDPVVAETILRELARGKTLTLVCRPPDMPDPPDVLDWCDQDAAFAERYARARERGYTVMADEVLEVADDRAQDWIKTENGDVFNGDHYQRSRLMVDTRKWLLSKALPKIYGDKLELGGANGGPLVVQVVEYVKPKEGEPDA